jgi:hypothetical protein
MILNNQHPKLFMQQFLRNISPARRDGRVRHRRSGSREGFDMTVPHTHNSQLENENTINTTVNVDPLTEPATAGDPDTRGHTRGSTGDRTPPRRSFSPDDRKLLVGSLGVLLAVFALVSSNVAANHSPKPHGLPIGIVGTPAAADATGAELARAAPGAYEVHAYLSLTAARTAVLHRSVYGAFRPAPAPVLLVASAASPPVAALLRRTFARVASRSGRPPVVHDLVPLPSSDSSGATSFSVVLSLILAGLAGTSLVYAFTRHRPEAARVMVTAAIAVGAGLITALVTNVLVAAYPGHFLAVWGLATLFVLAIGLPIAAFQVIFGIAGTAIGWILFLVIGNPASGGSSAPELLPGFWRTLSQILPPGAAVTSLRDVVYFNGHGSAHALIVLAVYAVLGAGVALIAYRLRTRAGAATTAG